MRAGGPIPGTVALLLSAGCHFDPSGGATGGGGDGGGAIDAATSDARELEWWDPAYRLRIPLAITTGPVAPEAGYAGYTARLAELDTATLIARDELLADCHDLRVVWWSGTAWSEIDRHLIGCGGLADVRFALVGDLASGATSSDYYLYLGNPAATAPPALRTTNVYLWYDDARADRSASYDRGRFDSWGSTNTWVDTLSWADRAYGYVRGDDQVSSYRRRVDERDVYVEAEMVHTSCFPGNMATGLVVRGIIASGSPESEESDHYYASMRAEQAVCGVGYAFDGDIVGTVRDLTVIDGVDPPPVAIGVWRAQGLAAFGAGPTHLRFWDSDAAWGTPGWPPAGALIASGDHATSDHQQAGFAGIWMAQDGGAFRGLLIRRYVEPEPSVSAGALESSR
jgi:hypothetical protein